MRGADTAHAPNHPGVQHEQYTRRQHALPHPPPAFAGHSGVATLAACGGSGIPYSARATDRQIAVAPGVSLHVRESAQGGAGDDVIVLLAGLGANACAFDSLAAALPGSRRLVIRDGFHRDFFIEHESTVVDAIEAMGWEGLQ